ncbi:MAG: hypothetical protein HC906_11530 [Bacteroidales bacterium]|nr:hypothetical protein [Bacteroidales bacterium]
MKYSSIISDKIDVGLQAENDAGEDFFINKSKGFDFYSGYVMLKNAGIVKQLILGDYTLQFGQGLMLWSGPSFGKANFTSASKMPVGIKKYGSSGEIDFFRGGAVTFQIKKMEFTTFLSYKNIDARLLDTISEGTRSFSSFLSTGFHRTPTEKLNEKSVKEMVMGSNVSVKWDNFHYGITLARHSFDAYYSPPDQPYNAYTFRGKNITGAGTDFRWRLKKALFFGELATGNKHLAGLAGVDFYPHSLISVSFIYRNLSPGYFARINNPFTEYSSKTMSREVTWLPQLHLLNSPDFRLMLMCLNHPGSGTM